MGSDDERHLFRELLADVTPLEQDGVPPPPRRTRPPQAGGEVRRDAFQRADFAERPDSFHRGGLRRTTLRQLRRGDFHPQSRIDLHGYARDRAQRTLEAFLERALDHGITCALVIHGKGTRSEQRVAVLRQMVRAVLGDHPGVLAYTPARPQDGGEGAVYVYLKAPRN
jgi:DNA-nicking Smr family endonuclease